MWGWDALCSVGSKIDKTIREDAAGKIREYAPHILPSPDVARAYATGISIGIAKYATAEILRAFTGGMPVTHILAEMNRSSGQLFQREVFKITQELEKQKIKQEKMEEMMISRQELMLSEMVKIQQANMVLTSQLAELKQLGRVATASNVQQLKKAEKVATKLLSHLDYTQLRRNQMNTS